MSYNSYMKIMSGGQTGVDRAALDVAIEMGINYGGFVPKGRKAEDGVIPKSYNKLIETKETDYKIRTELNVKKSNATLILYYGKIFGGTLLTKEIANTNKKPYLCVNLNKKVTNIQSQINLWLEIVKPKILNIAGPRESTSNGIYEKTKAVLKEVFKQQC